MKRIALLAVWVAACGGGDGGSGAAIPIDDLGARVKDALCEYEVRCGLAPDKAGCEESLSVQQQLIADVKAGTVKYDGKAAAACLGLYAQLGCKISDAGLSSVGRAPACWDAIRGTMAAGAACLIDEECQSQACDLSACTGPAQCCAGTCVARIAAGGDCLATGSECADDLVCKYDSTASAATCAAPIADGQPCNRNEACVPGRVCNLTVGTTAGTCGPPAARGQSCADSVCDLYTDICDPASKTCVARIAVGGDCSGNASGCLPYASCDAATMKCVMNKRAGEACTDASRCLSGVACASGVCVRRPDVPACM